MIKADIKTDFNENEFIRQFNGVTDDIYREMAEKCEHYAIMNIKGHTGNLQLSIKAKKSKFENGGWICLAESRKGPHAFLVEYGTDKPRLTLTKDVMRFEIDGEVIFAKVVAPMPANPFMRPARDRVVSDFARALR